MNINTKVGIKVGITEEGERKYLSFNEPIQTIELSKKESKKLALLLINKTQKD